MHFSENGDNRLAAKLLDECSANGDKCQAESVRATPAPHNPRVIYYQPFPHGGRVRITSYLPDEYEPGPLGF
jgi:hypothetical protein